MASRRDAAGAPPSHTPSGTDRASSRIPNPSNAESQQSQPSNRRPRENLRPPLPKFQTQRDSRERVPVARGNRRQEHEHMSRNVSDNEDGHYVQVPSQSELRLTESSLERSGSDRDRPSSERDVAIERSFTPDRPHLLSEPAFRDFLSQNKV